MESLHALNANAKSIRLFSGKSGSPLYAHQLEAIQTMNQIDKKSDFSALVVLPTGGGKTRLATTWLLSHAIDQNKKVLWIAHRYLLLDQAAEAFERNASKSTSPNRESFSLRIVSGAHDKAIHIKPSDDIIIAGKDSLGQNLDILSKWLKNEKTVYVVIDEAHHATARTYRIILDHIRRLGIHIKLLGLTATPMRTWEKEQNLLGEIFQDNIIYKVDLSSLINRGILSQPYCEDYDTKAILCRDLGPKALRQIENFDMLPEDLLKEIAGNKERNRVIVDQYYKDDNWKRYGQTLVFAVNQDHAIALCTLFNQYGKRFGIRADYVISGTKAGFIGTSNDKEANSETIDAFRRGCNCETGPDTLQILINVNILTEGIDLPKVQTVFLARPTVSTILMTQMVGRALRGVAAGGTEKAYIVSFVDDWDSKVAWVAPASVFDGGEFTESSKPSHRELHLISISKLEEFARMVNDLVDTTDLECVNALERVPLGMYVFNITIPAQGDDNEIEHTHQILVYDNSFERYEDLMRTLPDLFTQWKIKGETIDDQTLNKMVSSIEHSYFDINMIPAYNPTDIEYLLRYYAQKGITPEFVPINQMDRAKLDVGRIAADILDRDLGPRAREAYLDTLWNESDGVIASYFGKKYFLRRQVDLEIDKLLHPDDYVEHKEVIPETVTVESLSLEKIRNSYPDYFRKLREGVFESARIPTGDYKCHSCGYTSRHRGLFQVDHIYPMAKGGLTKPENLQLLCTKCNRKKSDNV